MNILNDFKDIALYSARGNIDTLKSNVDSLPDLLSSYFSDQSSKPTVDKLKQKKVLVLTNSGGGGHVAAAKAVEKALNNDYSVTVAKPFDHLTGDSLFNKFQKEGNHEMLELIVKMQPVAENLLAPVQVMPELVKLIDQEKPDLIVSVFPVANYLTWELAKEKNIPMLVLITDLEARHFFNNIKNPGKNFRIGIPFEDRRIIDPLRAHAALDDSNFVVTGYPLRQEFGFSSEQHAPTMQMIRQELNIAAEDKVIIIMMGAQGVGDAVTRYAEKIANSEIKCSGKLHVVALCGQNNELKKTAEKIKGSNNGVQVHALGMKDGVYVAALMKMSDGIITKPGGSTVNEVIASELPALYYSKGAKGAPWETVNMNYAIDSGWAEELQDDVFIEQVDRLLVKGRIQVESCPGKSFDLRLQQAISNMLIEPREAYPKKYNIRNMLQTQQRLKDGKATVLDKIKLFLINREINYVLENAAGNQKIGSIISELGKETPKIQMREVASTMAELTSGLQKSGLDHDSLMEHLFPELEESLARKLENKVIKYAVKNHPSLVMEFSAGFIPTVMILQSQIRLQGFAFTQVE